MIFRCHIQLSGESDLVIAITSQAMDFIITFLRSAKGKRKPEKTPRKLKRPPVFCSSTAFFVFFCERCKKQNAALWLVHRESVLVHRESSLIGWTGLGVLNISHLTILRKPAGRLGVVSPCERSEN